MKKEVRYRYIRLLWLFYLLASCKSAYNRWFTLTIFFLASLGSKLQPPWRNKRKLFVRVFGGFGHAAGTGFPLLGPPGMG